MIKILCTALFSIVVNLANILLAPINLLIFENFPTLNDALLSISSYFTLVGTYINYFVDALALTDIAINMLIFYFSFMLIVPVSVSVIKIAIKWYHYLIP